MIDWENCKPEDFSVSYLIEEISVVGDRHVFPVMVYHSKTDEHAFSKTVPIRTEFYEELRASAEWKPMLQKILKARVRDDITERINNKKLPIDDKLSLFSEDRETL